VRVRVWIENKVNSRLNILINLHPHTHPTPSATFFWLQHELQLVNYFVFALSISSSYYNNFLSISDRTIITIRFYHFIDMIWFSIFLALFATFITIVFIERSLCALPVMQPNLKSTDPFSLSRKIFSNFNKSQKGGKYFNITQKFWVTSEESRR
jgi:hypothetical protein